MTMATQVKAEIGKVEAERETHARVKVVSGMLQAERTRFPIRYFNFPLSAFPHRSPAPPPFHHAD
jgi:hypothetical protein